MATTAQPSKRNRQLVVPVAEYEHPLYLVKIKPIIEKLKEAMPDAKLDAKLFGQSLAGMQQMMEDALGKNANPEFKKYPKLPMSVFRDYTPEGPLLLIAKAFWTHMQTRLQGKRIQFEVPILRRENMELLQAIRRQLTQAGYVKTPIVWISPQCGHDIPLLAQSVRKLQGEVAKDITTPGITHAVYPFGEKGDPDDGQEYMRTLEHRDPKTSLVHYWYLPDSYDECIAADVAPSDIEPPHAMPGIIKVFSRWLRDSEAFNEWMNPNDYWTEEYEKEVEAWEKAHPEQAAAAAAQGGVGEKRPREEDEAAQAMPVVLTAAAAAAAAANLRLAKKTRTEEEPGAGVVVAEGVTHQVIQLPNKAATDVKTVTEDISHGQRSMLEGPAAVPQALAPPAAGVDVGVDAGDGDAKGGNVETKGGGGMMAVTGGRVLYRVPAHSAWFDWDKVHRIEVREVAEFFNNSVPGKTPETYREYRNALINLYRRDVHKHLSWSHAKRVLAGDAAAILHIWEFCDRWGLINFQAPHPSAAGVDAADVVPDEMGGPSGARVLALPPAPSLDAVFRFHKPTTARHMAAITQGGTTGEYKLITKADALLEPSAPSGDRKPRYFCNARPWVDCTKKRYHCTRIPDVDLCPEAYASGQFPPGCTGKDFVLIEAGKEGPPSADGWTEQETLLLLEGLELYGDKWDDVAEHVGSKTQLACIMHFLSLPIEEQFVDEAISGGPGVPGPVPAGEDGAGGNVGGGNVGGGVGVGEKGEGGGGGEEEEEDGFVPFADAGNPLMAQLAFLATMVGPRVAAAAAKRALEYLGEVEDEEDTPMVDVHGVNGNDATEGPMSSARMQAAAATALAAAAVKAKTLAMQEEREIQRLTLELIELQSKKIEEKAKQLNAFEEALEKERAHLQTLRKKLTEDITRWRRAKAATAANAQAAAAQGAPAQQPVEPEAAGAVATAAVPVAPADPVAQQLPPGGL